MTPTANMSTNARLFSTALSRFTVETAGVLDTVAVSSDGLLVAASATLDRADADRLSAVVSAMATLATSVSGLHDFGNPRKAVIDLERGYLLVNVVGPELTLGVLAHKKSDLGEIAYEIAMFSNRVASVATSEVVEELKEHDMA